MNELPQCSMPLLAELPKGERELKEELARDPSQKQEISAKEIEDDSKESKGNRQINE